MNWPKCKTHPRYEANREPRSECQACWLRWLCREVARLSRDNDAAQAQIRDIIHGDGWL